MLRESKTAVNVKLLLLLLGLVLFALCEPAEGAQHGAAQDVPAVGDSWVEPVTGMVFKWIPAGCFLMGSPEGEVGRNADEGPQHQVCLAGFWMGKTEVTVGQWRVVMGSDPSLIKNGDTYPVDMVSWDMAREFAAKLSGLAGSSFRLPTEAEWEYACRAGSQTSFTAGEMLRHDEATFDKRFRLPAEPLKPRRKSRRKAAKPKPKVRPGMHTTAAASFPANAFGLHDMHGNLWEWCEDIYAAGFYARSPRDNPRNDGQGVSRVLRGGSWVTKQEALRSANRGNAWPDLRTAFYGLRLVLPAPSPEAAAPVGGSSR